MARYSKEQIQQSRVAILTSAAELFRVHGFDGVGIKDIVTSAGLTNGTFYTHFSSKKDLFNEVILEANTVRANKINEMKNLSPIDRASQFIASYLSVEHLENRSKGCLMPKLAGALQSHRKTNARSVDSYVGDFKMVFSDCGIKESDINFLSSSLVGGLVMARTMSKKDAVEFLNDVKKKCLELLVN